MPEIVKAFLWRPATLVEPTLISCSLVSLSAGYRFEIIADNGDSISYSFLVLVIHIV
jgi:hypothetical protein